MFPFRQDIFSKYSLHDWAYAETRLAPNSGESGILYNVLLSISYAASQYRFLKQ